MGGFHGGGMGGFHGAAGGFHGGGFGPGFQGGGWHGGHGDFHGGHFHDHSGVDFVFGLGWPYVGWPSYYPYYDYYPRYTPYTDYRAYPPDVPYATTNASTNWYYCDDPQGYYPYVRFCNSGWQSVLSTPQS
jgi:hypothetical protein